VIRGRPARSVSSFVAPRAASARAPRWALFLVLCASTAGCATDRPPSSGAGAGGRAVDFSFAGIDGQTVSDERVAGRVTVLLFATTFDLNSQAQAKFLEDLYRTRAPRINAVLVFLEPPKYVELARSFRDILGLSYPVALADHEQLRAGGRFPSVHAVPTWVVLDQSAKVDAFHEGTLDDKTLLHLVEKAE